MAASANSLLSSLRRQGRARGAFQSVHEGFDQPASSVVLFFQCFFQHLRAIRNVVASVGPMGSRLDDAFHLPLFSTELMDPLSVETCVGEQSFRLVHRTGLCQHVRSLSLVIVRSAAGHNTRREQRTVHHTDRQLHWNV